MFRHRPFGLLRRTRSVRRRGLRNVAALSTVLLGLGVVPAALFAPGAQAGVVAPVGQGFTVAPSDLAYILTQIKIAERHAATRTPQNPCGTLIGPGPDQIPDPLRPYGLRTVDGSCNNLFDGQQTFGATDQVFPRLTTPTFRPADGVPAGFFGPGSPAITSSSYASKTGNVFDAQPRMISNLIDDQTSENPAAVAAAEHPVRAQAGAPGVTPCTTDPAPDGTGGVPANCVPSHHTLFIPNVTTDVGLSPPYNSMFTFFGQFFDHGIDQTVKGGGTVFVPLQADDPLITLGPDGKANTGDEVPPSQAFMVLTRAQNQPGPDGVLGTADDVHEATNTDSPWVDQSQTYASHPAHQVFLREYVANADGQPVSTGKMLGGAQPDSMATWADVKAQAATKLGLLLTDRDVLNVPMLATDPYGRFTPGPNGLPQYVTQHGLVEGSLAAPVPVPSDVVYFDTPFLTDIAHNADPSPQDTDHNPATPPVAPTPDADHVASADFASQPPGTYDDEMLDAHFIAGDGRVNENIALTAIHQVFHSEHNRLVDDIKRVLTTDAADNPETGGPALAQWKLPSFDNPSGWNGERLFQAAKFVTEMEYQHLVFEEFARKVQPAIQPFQSYHPDVNAAIHAEFAHAVYRFGHSMLDDQVARTVVHSDGSKTTANIPLLNAFLNPPEYVDGGAAGTLSPREAAGAIVMGSSDQVGNEMDEFVTETLRNNLLGLPLDLAAINLTRAREAGIPPLNEVRRQLNAASNDTQVAPYTSWADFGNHLKHAESLVNFIAAYGTYPTITDAKTLVGKRAAAQTLLDNSRADALSDAAAFVHSFGAWSNGRHDTSITGVDAIDLWVGGLAEATPLNGGLLGSTFNYVFENQLTDLQNGDRFYYLARTQGMNLLSQLEGNSFAEMIQRNTDGTHSLKADVFATADCRFQLAHLGGTAQDFTTSGAQVADDPETGCNESTLLSRKPDGTIEYRSPNPVDGTGPGRQSVYNGTGGDDRATGGSDDDTFWGGAGNDVLDGGGGNDVALGGAGDDILTDSGSGLDILKGGPGNDALDGGTGSDILLGGDGSDVTNGGANDNETFSGPGADFIIAGQGSDGAQGDGGDDWIEGGTGVDTLSGDFGAPFSDDPGEVAPGNDVLIGQDGNNNYAAEGGDDVMTSSKSIDRFFGVGGFDWVSHQYDTAGADDDMTINTSRVGVDPPAVPNRDRWQETEAVSGSAYDDVIRGDDAVPSTLGGAGVIGCDALDQAGINRIAGLRDIVPVPSDPVAPVIAQSTPGYCPLTGKVWGRGNILLGGAGSDTLEGRGGDDILDGDRALTIRISVRAADDHAREIGSTDLLEHTADPGGSFGLGTDGMTLQQAVFQGLVDPGQLVTVREITTPPPGNSVDTAVFSDLESAYSVTTVPAGAKLGDPGSVTTVTHRGGGADGTDTLRNIERLVFKTAVPDPVTNLTAEALDGSAVVSWTPPAQQVTTYRVEAVDAKGQLAASVTVDGSAVTATVTGLTNGVPYTFRVLGTNSTGTGSWAGPSNTVIPNRPVVLVLPAAPGPGPGPVLTSALSASATCRGCRAVLSGTVRPVTGVTVTLTRKTGATFVPVAQTVLTGDSPGGHYAFTLPTSASRQTCYRVVVTGAGIEPQTGPSLTLRVYAATLQAVSPQGKEYVVLQNTGRVTEPLKGWRLTNGSGLSVPLRAYSLRPGEVVKIFTGRGHNTRHRIFLRVRANLWRAAHDTATLHDRAGATVTSLRY